MRLPLAALILAAPAAAIAAPPPPKLIVAISIDQYSANLFEEWRPRYSAGLKTLASGIAYPSAYQSHAGTETCPGHSTLMTGRHPNKTGIVANTMRDETTGKSVYCLADDSVALAHDATAPAVGPKRLMVDTLGEWLKAASPQSRVVSISGKDRGAITMAGHAPDGVFWTFPGYGFTTYIRPGGDAAAALAPVAPVNAANARIWTTRPTWTYQHPQCRALAADWSIGGRTFDSSLPPASYASATTPADIGRAVMASPVNDEMTLAGARQMLRHYKLGRGPATDLLTVSFSATDLIGHMYGSRGPEMCEQMYRLDATIGTLLKDIDALRIPYLVVLTADHGASDLTERLASRGYPAHRVNTAAIVARVNQAAMAATGLASPPLSGGLDELVVAPAVSPADRARVLAAARAALAREVDVAGAFTIDELLATPIPKDMPADELTLRERFAESAWRGRSGDLMVALKPELTADAKPDGPVAGHGSPWNYDRRVPMLFWWKGAPQETRFLPVETVDIAPTLAAAVNVTPPADVDGRCLPIAAACPAPR